MDSSRNTKSEKNKNINEIVKQIETQTLTVRSMMRSTVVSNKRAKTITPSTATSQGGGG